MDMDMGNMDGSGHSMSTAMVFTTDHSTPLYSSRWTPKTTGTYAATCIFLIFLAVITRLLVAYRHQLELKWHDKAVQRRYIMVRGASPGEQEIQSDASSEKSDEATLTTRGMNESVRVLRTPRKKLQYVPWRISTDLPRACLFTLIAGLGYLLMLAVMTLNVGYFMSVLTGLFVGELAIGRYIVVDDGHH